MPIVYHRFSDGVEIVRCVLEFCKVGGVHSPYLLFVHPPSFLCPSCSPVCIACMLLSVASLLAAALMKRLCYQLQLGKLFSKLKLVTDNLFINAYSCVCLSHQAVAEVERSYSSSIHRLLQSTAYTFHSNLLMQWLGNEPYEEIG